MIDENRWRASRYGLEGKLIDFGRETEVETRSLMHELLEFIDGEIDELGIQREIEHVERILGEGTGADRQLETWARTRDMREVVDQIVRETYEGLEIAAPEPAPLAVLSRTAGGLPARDFHAMLTAIAAMPDLLDTETLDAESAARRAQRHPRLPAGETGRAGHDHYR